MKIGAFALFTVAGMLLMTSCQGPRKDYVLKVKLTRLTAADIFNKDMVQDVIFDAEELNADSLKNASRQLFLKGVDQYKNKHSLQEAISLFKSSILTFPDAKAYYELGNALLEINASPANREDALKSFEIAERLNFQPLSNVFYKKACVLGAQYSANTNNNDRHWLLEDAIRELRDAFKNGYSDTVALMKDQRLADVVATPDYHKLRVEMEAQQVGAGSGNMFALFKRSFHTIHQPFEVVLDKVDMKEYTESISYDFAKFIPEMENTDFGREVSHDYFYVGKIAETPEYTAIIYSSISFWGEYMQPVYTTLATFDNNGNIKSRKLIGCQCSAEKVKRCSIANNRITIEEYKRTWESPIDQVSFEENKVKENVLVSKAIFRIDEHGVIQDEEVPKNFKDSTIVAVK